MSEARANTPAERRTRQRPEKKLVVEDRVWFELDGVPATEREALRAAITGYDSFRTLGRNPRGVGASGRLRLVDVAPPYLLMYEETPTRVTILDVVSTRVLDVYDVETYPVPKPKAKKPPRKP